MSRFVFLLAFASMLTVSIAFRLRLTLPHHLDPTSDQVSQAINRLNSTWKAENHFRGYKLRDLRFLMGTFRHAEPEALPVKPMSEYDLNEPIPDEFDVRDRWTACADIVSHVRDQGACGSCWAFGAAEAISDRVCIGSNGSKAVLISSDDLLSCCGLRCGMGCNGGFPGSAWKYWVHKGLVSGGDFGDKGTCRPYEIAPCEHHAVGPRPNCSSEDASTPKCVHRCQDGFGGNYNDDRHFGAKAYSVHSSEEAIQRELMSGGSVEGAFDVYSDFPSYKSGVYQAHSTQFLGGHAIKIIGWGVTTDNVKYWLAVNSWNTDWGDKGFFKILRGVDECGIESSVVAGVSR